MPRRLNNETIKRYFDEESIHETTFMSTASDDYNSENYILEDNDNSKTSNARQPLIRSNQRTLKNVSSRSSYKPKPKSKQKSNFQNTLMENRILRSSYCAPSTLSTPITKASKSRRKAKTPKKWVLKEIQKFQNTTDLLIPKLPFSKVIREILINPEVSKNQDLRITPRALEALQETAEIYLTIFFEDAYRCTLHRGRLTLIVKDMELVRSLRGVNDLGYIN